MQSAMSAFDPPSRPVLGYRFNPTDRELITHYLAKKINDEYVSPSLIPTCDNMYTTDPLNLPIDNFVYGIRNEAFYFVLRQNIGTRGKRQTAVGTWKAGGVDKPITDCRGIEVGHVLQLSYHYQGAKKASGWIMHEYRLGSKEHTKAQKANQEWVLCRIRRPTGISKSDRAGDFGRAITKFEVGENRSAITMAYDHDLAVVAPSPWQAVGHNNQDIPMGEAQVKEEMEAAAVTRGPCTSTVSQGVETCNPKTVLPSISYMDLELEALFTVQAPSSQDYIASEESAGFRSSDGRGGEPASSGAGVLLPPVDRSLPPNIIIHPFESWDKPRVEFVEGKEEEVGFFNTPHLYFLFAGQPPKSLGS